MQTIIYSLSVLITIFIGYKYIKLAKETSVGSKQSYVKQHLKEFGVKH